jgi:outer membrane protein
MKNKFVVLLFLVGILTLPQRGVAQQKIGYIDSQLIIDQLPDAQDAKRRLEILSSEWQGEIKRKKDKLDKLFKEYQAKEILYTDELKAQKQKELVAFEQDVATYQNQKFGPNGEYFQQQTALMKPIQDRIFTAMKQVAITNKYDFVFDKSGEVLLLYSNEEYDLTAAVLEKLRGLIRVGTPSATGGAGQPQRPAPTLSPTKP